MISLILAIVGMLTFIDRTGQISFTGIFLAILSGVTYAFYILYIDKSGLKKMDAFKLTFYLSLVVTGCLLIYGSVTLVMGSNKHKIDAFGLILLNEELSLLKFIGCFFILLSAYAITKEK